MSSGQKRLRKNHQLYTHGVQLIVPVSRSFRHLQPAIWLVRDRCPLQGAFVGACLDALREFVESHFPKWEMEHCFNSAQLGAFRIRAGYLDANGILPGGRVEMALLVDSGSRLASILHTAFPPLFRG